MTAPLEVIRKAGGRPRLSDAKALTDVEVRIAGRICARRQERGLTQTQLAAAIGVSFQQLQKYEHGANRISCGRLAEIAAALGAHPGDFFPPITPIEKAA
jgi:transcriptional regulator with XRE-family HTH domain